MASKFLEGRTTESIIRAPGPAWRGIGNRPDFPFRQRVLEASPAETGFSAQVLAAGLDQFFQQLTGENLTDRCSGRNWGTRDGWTIFSQRRRRSWTSPGHGHRAALDGAHRPRQHPRARAHGNGAGVAGALGPIYQMRFGPGFCAADVRPFALRGGPQAGRVPGNRRLERRFREPGIGAVCRSRLHRRHGQRRNIGRDSDEVAPSGAVHWATATRSASVTSRGRRWSASAHAVVEQAAADVTAWNQRGCLSPHVIYVEENGRQRARISPSCWPENWKRWRKRIRAARCRRRRGGHRDPARLLRSARRAFAGHQDVGQPRIHRLDGHFGKRPALPNFLSKQIHLRQGGSGVEPGIARGRTGARENFDGRAWRASRSKRPNWRGVWRAGARKEFVRSGQMQHPPLGWRHDGRPPLGDLVTWIDWEK